MKKSLVYIILIILALLMVGAVYLQYRKSGSFFNASQKPDNTQTENTENSDNSSLNSDGSVAFKNYGSVPEFTGINKWLNSDGVKMSDLRGKVVLVNFWTYSNINSVRSLPYITKWHDTYKDKDFVVIGVHTPEFAFEKVFGNVAAATKSNGINYPVAQDNDYKTWIAYQNQFWPAQYLIDKEGNIVYTQFGEGNYDVTEKAIRTLLGIEGDYQAPAPTQANQANTPEMYFGLARQKDFGNTEKPSGDTQIYVLPKKLGNNKFALEGSWQFTQEAAIHTNGFGRIKLNFDAAKVFMVAQSNTPTTIRVFVDGTLIKGVVVNNSDLYQLYDSIAGGKHTMEIEVPDSGFQAFTFTFG